MFLYRHSYLIKWNHPTMYVPFHQEPKYSRAYEMNFRLSART